MNATTKSYAFFTADLLAEIGEGWREVPGDFDLVDVRRQSDVGWMSWCGGRCESYDKEPTRHQLARAALRAVAGCRPGRFVSLGGLDSPFNAWALAQRIQRRNPLSEAELLADSDFITEARRAAEAGKKYTAVLLEWTDKATATKLVAALRVGVEERLAREAEAEAREEAERKAKEEAERPTKDAVLAAYKICGYRECKQGHAVRVELVANDMAAGAHAKTNYGGKYSSRCTYSKTESAHKISVPANWLQTVARIGCATWEGRLVLRAKVKGATTDGRVVFDLLTVHQSRGTLLQQETITVVVRMNDLATTRRLRKDDALASFTDPRITRDYVLDCGYEDAPAGA